jgi:hypothetical protein
VTALAGSATDIQNGQGPHHPEGAGMRGQQANDDDSVMTGTCAKHWTERAVAQCRDCHEFFCADCLVPPLKKSQPLRCIECALIAAGIRGKGPRGNPMTNMNSTRKRSITSG